MKFRATRFTKSRPFPPNVRYFVSRTPFFFHATVSVPSHREYIFLRVVHQRVRFVGFS